MSYVVGTLFLSASLLVFGLTFAGVLFVSFTRARRKGYHPPGAVLIILAGWAVGIATRIAWDPLNFVARGGPGAGNVDFVWVPLLASADFFWLPLLFSALATAVLIGASPQRKLRVFGQRQARFPFIGVGQVLFPLLLFGAMVVLYVSHNLKLSNALNVGAFLFVIVILAAPTALYLINRGRRIKGASSFDQFLDRETESLVLYLRPFNQESKFFVIGKASDYGAYAKSWHAKVSGDQFNIGITLEEYLADTITDLIGPFVALGSPEDYVTPEGALRMYAKDSEWMDQLDQLAKRSTCIIVQLASSDNLRWEFEHLRHEGLQQKLFIITPQSREGTRFQWAFFDLLWYLKGIRSVSWRAFSDDLAKLGYDLGFEDPGPGSVIGFEAEGRGVLLTTQANRPAEFVEPISVWLAERRIIGRSVRASCLSCGQMFYGFPTRAGTVRARFCRNCEPGLTSRQLTWLSLYFPLIMLSWVLVVVGLACWMPEEAWLGGIAALIALVMLFFVLLAREKRRVAQRVVERYRKIAEEGDAIAMTYLGALYHRGREGLAKMMYRR